MLKIQFKTNQSNPTIQAYKEAVEKGKKNQHILPYEGKWAVGNLVSGKPSHVFNDTQKAIEYAEANATAGTAVFIHGSDGRIRERKDY